MVLLHFFEYNNQFLECIADAGAQYTIWYVLTPEIFIASSSQRIIVSLLQSFEENYRAWQHFLYRGALGLGQSWDRRINHVRNRECIILDRDQWELRKKRVELPLQNIKLKMNDEEFISNLKEDIIGVLENINIDWSKYRLLLSGGYDSRLLYLIFHNNNCDVRTFSWTNNIDTLNQDGTDGYIAKKLTDFFKTDHTVYYMDTDDRKKMC